MLRQQNGVQDRAIQEELDELVRSPDRLRRYVDYKKAETAFRLWDLDANGKVLRDKITRGLLKCALNLLPLCCLSSPPAAAAFLTHTEDRPLHLLAYCCGNKGYSYQAGKVMSKPCVIRPRTPG